MVRPAVAGKGQPRAAHPVRKFHARRVVARERRRLDIAEHEGDFQRVARAQPPAQHRRLPGEEIDEHPTRLLRELAVGDLQRRRADTEIGNDGNRDLVGAFRWLCLAVGCDHLGGACAEIGLQSFGQVFESCFHHPRLMADEQRLLVLVGTDHQRHIGRDGGRRRRKRPAGEDLAVDHGIEAEPPPVGSARVGDARQHGDLRFEQARRRNLAQLAGLRRLQSKMREHLTCGVGAVPALGHLHGGAALDDGLVKETLGAGQRHQHAHFGAPARLAEDGDVAGIAAEGRDIVPHPFEGGHDIHRASGASAFEIVARDVFKMEIAQRTQAMIERDHHDIVGAAEVGAVGPGRGAGAGDEGAAMAPEQDGPLGARYARRPDVEVETILVALLAAAESEEFQQIGRQGEDIVILHRPVAVVHGLAHAHPGLGFARRPQAQRPQRRCSIGNSLEDADAALHFAAHFPGRGLDDDASTHVRFILPFVQYRLSP